MSSITDFSLLPRRETFFFPSSISILESCFSIVGTHVLGDWICLPVPTQMAKTQFPAGRTKFQANSTFSTAAASKKEEKKVGGTLSKITFSRH